MHSSQQCGKCIVNIYKRNFDPLILYHLLTRNINSKSIRWLKAFEAYNGYK